MSYTTTVNIPAIAAPTAPRGARWAAAAASWLMRQLQAPAAARPAADEAKLRAREAAEVRRYAESIREADPRFASDLFAAADRHEVGA